MNQSAKIVLILVCASFINVISCTLFDTSHTCSLHCTKLVDTHVQQPLCECKKESETVQINVPVSHYCTTNYKSDPLCEDRCHSLSYHKFIEQSSDKMHVSISSGEHPDHIYDEYQHSGHEHEHLADLPSSHYHHHHSIEDEQHKTQESKRLTIQLFNDIVESCRLKNCKCKSIPDHVDDNYLSTVVYDEYWTKRDHQFHHDEL
jgi:hypothetical protein